MMESIEVRYIQEVVRRVNAAETVGRARREKKNRRRTHQKRLREWLRRDAALSQKHRRERRGDRKPYKEGRIALKALVE
jgi:hypothetical protein